jgi:hypothetical protein
MNIKLLLRVIVASLIVVTGLLVYLLTIRPSQEELLEQTFLTILEQSINDSGVNASPADFTELFKFPTGVDFSQRTSEKFINDLINWVQNSTLSDGDKDLLTDELIDSLTPFIPEGELYINADAAEVVKDFPNLTVSPVLFCQQVYGQEVLLTAGLGQFPEINKAYLRYCEYETGISYLYSLIVGNISPLLKSQWLYCEGRPTEIDVLNDITLIFCNTSMSTASTIINDSLIKIIYTGYTDETYELMYEFLGLE